MYVIFYIQCIIKYKHIVFRTLILIFATLYTNDPSGKLYYKLIFANY